LLSCVHCNSSKGHLPVTVADYLWPDSDNTLRALVYSMGGLVQASPLLPLTLRTKAQAIIHLAGLDKFPGNPGREPTSSDKRWQRRFEAWQLADRDRQLLAANNSPEVRELIVENARGRGMFSIWWTVFAGDVDMRRRLRQAFQGTDASSFDANEDACLRPGGQV
jgi:hypothetical protein